MPKNEQFILRGRLTNKQASSTRSIHIRYLKPIKNIKICAHLSPGSKYSDISSTVKSLLYIKNHSKPIIFRWKLASRCELRFEKIISNVSLKCTSNHSTYKNWNNSKLKIIWMMTTWSKLKEAVSPHHEAPNLLGCLQTWYKIRYSLGGKV